jgi:hypothetical protein
MEDYIAMATQEAVVADGRHAFDFIAGTWSVATRACLNPLDHASPHWIEFPAEFTSIPILAGTGTIDIFRARQHPVRDDYEALILRLFDPVENVWRIWWISTLSNGQLDVPVVGRFVDTENGLFECDDIIGGVPIKVRGTWKIHSAASIEWKQAFSFDDGQSWEPNWISQATRIEPGRPR